MAGLRPMAGLSPMATGHKQSFRAVAKEIERGPRPMVLAASGDHERLGQAFANFSRFRGQDPPEETLVPFRESPEAMSTLASKARMAATAPSRWNPSDTIKPAPASRPMFAGATIQERRARKAVSVTSPLYGVETIRREMFDRFLQDSVFDTQRQKTLTKTHSAPQLFAHPPMTVLSTDLPDRPDTLIPSWTEKKNQTHMIWHGVEKEGWSKMRKNMLSP
eukprot:TRINITY_DN28237_c0_g2_i1.p1 TRINITY_DN28237_c0_g2~~TRINITY_DN28237_c0_g2_i1.p1  ORF type:complete len:220 (+),score=15.50 TRINITY_DN28237_c0_g2_i1:39-698(+)